MKPKYRALFAVGLLALSCTAEAQHWAFKAPVRYPAPAVKHVSWVRNPIDAFVLSRLEKRGLAPSPPADKRTLLRRVTFDLTGLPPTPDEISAFLADLSPHAYDNTVNRLLASKRFGERWAQHWLDIVRFAESNGYEHDLDRPQAWRYRDWVVEALNADRPFDWFLQQQVAGDLIAPDDFNARVATGFLRTGPFHITGGNLDAQEMRQEWLTEAVAGIGNGILGLTIGCARCHNHKFDPIPQMDYYRLQAYFAATANEDKSPASADDKKRYDEAVSAAKARMKPIDAQISAIEQPYRQKVREQKLRTLGPACRAALAIDTGKRSPEQKKLAAEANSQLSISWDEVVNALRPDDRARRAALRKQLFAIERDVPPLLPAAEGVADAGHAPAPMHVLLRGDVHNPGPEVTPGTPGCLAAPAGTDVIGEHPRLQLARWLTAPNNALTSRVFVNRLWQYLFGRGLVATPNDFGNNGQPPSHPELLDWLATTFTGSRPSGQPGGASGDVGCGWSVKSMVALIVTSNTYRQACLYDRVKATIDPDNRLLWRMNRKRLDAEELRDSVLAANGTLNLELGGPSVRVPLEPEVYDTIFTESEPDNLWPVTPDIRQHTRRSLYLFRKRNVRLPMMALFDQPDMMSSCAARGQTVHALQALTLVDSEFMRKQSLVLAQRLCTERPIEVTKTTAKPNPAARTALIDRLFLLTLGREPRSDERRATERFLVEQTALMTRRLAHHELLGQTADASSSKATPAFLALADLCLATLNLNEFVYIR